jgi:hypothetical protein
LEQFTSTDFSHPQQSLNTRLAIAAYTLQTRDAATGGSAAVLGDVLVQFFQCGVYCDLQLLAIFVGGGVVHIGKSADRAEQIHESFGVGENNIVVCLV